MQHTSPDRIIRLEIVCKHMKDHSYDNVDTMYRFLCNYSTFSRFNRIVVSVGAGMAETEMHSDEMCICLDLDKRSFFSSHFALRFLRLKSPTSSIADMICLSACILCWTILGILLQYQLSFSSSILVLPRTSTSFQLQLLTASVHYQIALYRVFTLYRLVRAKKVTLAAICLDISSASFGIGIN